MKKMLLLFFIIANLNIYSQAIKIQLDLNDGSGGSQTMFFGVDPAATDGIDDLLNEIDLPPIPPVGAFDARFYLPLNNFSGELSSHEDYRNGNIPYTGQKIYKLRYQKGLGTVMNISWNFPVNVDGLLQDAITGTLINQTMSGSGTYQVTNPDAFSSLKMTINYNNVLPVELTSFSAAIISEAIELHWETATEINNSGFVIERKQKGTSWKNIGFVNGAGNSNIQNHYKYFDSNISVSGKYYYRLKQVDFNGTAKYYPQIEVDILKPSAFSLDQNFPNPFNPSTSIAFRISEKSNVRLSVYNVIGEFITEIVNKELEPGKYIYNWKAGNMSSGVYIYELKTEGLTITRKMILNK